MMKRTRKVLWTLLLPCVLWAVPAAATQCVVAGCTDDDEVTCTGLVHDYIYLDWDGDGTHADVGCCCAPGYGGAFSPTVGDDCDDGDADAFVGAADIEDAGACMADEDDDGWGTDTPNAGVDPGTDCDDAHESTFPGAAEIEDGVACMTDVDDDGWGSDTVLAGVTAGQDCNDADDQTYWGALELCDAIDNDCDGSLPVHEQDVDGDTYMECAGDCDDGDFDINPGAVEVECDGDDNDCNGATPDEEDVDGDGNTTCDSPPDCDDNDPERYWGYSEICDGIDNDCNGVIPPGEQDADGDGYLACDDDCDDGDGAVNPGAAEVSCNGIDDDCNGATPDEAGDVDGDGEDACTDCDDSDPDVYTGAPEVCDGVPDNNCDGTNDPDEIDNDLDGYTECTSDCNDFDPMSYPGATEACDGQDNNCDGLVPADEDDADGDGYRGCEGDCIDNNGAVHPGAFEVACDYVDNDCDGVGHDQEEDDDFDLYTECDGDCDDGDPSRNPGVAEVACDGIDNDCDLAQHDDDVDNDADGYTECTGDCDDTNAAVKPGVAEIACDFIDNNCDGVYHPEEVDDDGDGYSECEGDTDDTDPLINPDASEIACDDFDNNGDGVLHPLEVDNDGDGIDECGPSRDILVDDGDCDDADALTYPGAAYIEGADCMTDADGDGYGDDAATGDVTPGTDCDDTSSAIFPGAAELQCDHEDSNCDGVMDYQETDDDGDGFTECQGDCDDAESAVFPGAPESYCDDLDNDCDGSLHAFEVDNDGDGYTECGADNIYGTADDDPNDADPSIFPNASETPCDDIDNDGDGQQHAWDIDDDGDLVDECGPSNNLLIDDGDCNDADPAIYPGATEYCNAIDDDCDGDTDEENAADCVLYYLDADGDGRGDATDSECLCGPSGDYDTLLSNDCDDSNPSVHGDMTELGCDGLDNDCDGNLADTEDDGDLDGVTECGPDGLLGSNDDDCDDTDAGIFPGATEVECDGIDNDCDGISGGDVDLDGDGYSACEDDCDDTDDNTHPGAAAAELNSAECMTDADGDGFGSTSPAEGVTAGTDCDDTRTSVNPAMWEECEGTQQLDNDCDGSVNTHGGLYCMYSWDDYAFPDFDSDGDACSDPGADGLYGTADDEDDAGWASAVFYYWDNDGDEYGNDGTDCDDPGDPELYKVWLCDASVEGALVTAVSGDCDDTDAGINPDEIETCDEKDNNCNCQIDETLPDEDPANCRELHLDADRDGYGAPDESICLCLPTGTQTEDCENNHPTQDDSYFYEGECYIDDEGDCNDSDYLIHPVWEEGVKYSYELLDGADNDCDGEIPVVELDCDDDGYISSLPGFPFNAEIINGPLNETQSFLLDGAELWPCWGYDEGDPEDVDEYDWAEEGYQLTCWEQVVDIDCDEFSGLWMLTTAVAEDMFDHAKRYPAPVGVDDCDDNCAERYPGNFELCDGIDNDCTAAEFADVYPTEGVPGLPDAMESDLEHLGTVSSSEMDLDGDSYIGCVDNPTGKQEYFSSRTCTDPIPEVGDCNDLCSVTTPDAEEACNGFLDVCEDVGEGTDLDRDGHRACGAFSGDESMAEYIYVLGHIDPDAAVDEDRASVIPLILPRRGAQACDDRLERQLAFLLGEVATAEIILTQSLEPVLQYCITAHMCEDGQLEGEDCEGIIDGAGCTVMRLKIGEDQDTGFDELGVSASCEAHPEQLITRTVWHHDRVIQARELAAWWECYRVYGTYGCADLREPEDWWQMEETIVPGGRTWLNDEEFDEVIATGKKGWHELSRYDPEAIESVLTGCWDDDIAGALAQLRPPSDPIALDYTGGDCVNEDGDANRGESEGPDDLLGQFFGEAPDCRTCIDGVDNNCNGLTDCEDPACAECFIGQGVGCAASGSPCAETGCSTSGDSNEVKTSGAILAFLWLAAMTRIWRRVR